MQRRVKYISDYIATEFNCVWLIVLRSHVLRCRRLLKDLSAVHDVTGQINSNQMSCSTTPSQYQYRTILVLTRTTQAGEMDATYFKFDYGRKNNTADISRLHTQTHNDSKTYLCDYLPHAIRIALGKITMQHAATVDRSKERQNVTCFPSFAVVFRVSLTCCFFFSFTLTTVISFILTHILLHLCTFCTILHNK